LGMDVLKNYIIKCTDGYIIIERWNLTLMLPMTLRPYSFLRSSTTCHVLNILGYFSFVLCDFPEDFRQGMRESVQCFRPTWCTYTCVSGNPHCSPYGI
jgi:hypothetical protein